VPGLDLLHRHGPLRGLGFGLIGCAAVPITCDPPGLDLDLTPLQVDGIPFQPHDSGTEYTERWFPPDKP
jgi:hypothetical protein